MRTELPSILKAFRRQLGTIYGDRLVEVVLFGSYARGDARADSDVDVLIVLREPETDEQRARVLDLVTELNLEHAVLVNRVCISEEVFRTRQGPFLRNVRREGVPV